MSSRAAAAATAAAVRDCASSHSLGAFRAVHRSCSLSGCPQVATAAAVTAAAAATATEVRLRRWRHRESNESDD